MKQHQAIKVDAKRTRPKSLRNVAIFRPYGLKAIGDGRE